MTNVVRRTSHQKTQIMHTQLNSIDKIIDHMSQHNEATH